MRILTGIIVWSACLLLASCGNEVVSNRTTDRNAATAGATRVEADASDGQVKGLMNFDSNGDLSDDFQIALIYDGESGGASTTSEMPNDVLRILRAYVAQVDCGKPPPEAQVEHDIARLRAANRTINFLITQTTNTPKGKRNISFPEAGRIIEYLGIHKLEHCPK